MGSDVSASTTETVALQTISALHMLWLGGDHPGRMKLPLTKDQRKSISKAAGAGISAMRARAGMTQEDVAEALGIGVEAVSRLERGVVDPGVPRLVELAHLFDCGVAELLMGASPRAVDQVGLIAQDIANLPAKEREAIAAIVKQIAALLRAKRGRQAERG